MMIEIQQLIYFAIGIFNVITKTIQFAYLLSVIIGKRLAECIIFLAKSTWNIAEEVASVLNILYEDYVFFLQDVAYKISRIASILWSVAEAVVKLFASSYHLLKNLVFWTQDVVVTYFNAFLGVLGKVHNILVRIPDMLRNAIVLIGTGCYFALQIIPVAIVYILSMIVFMVGRSFEEIISIVSLMKYGICVLFNGMIQFFMELPSEAVIGLVFGCLVLYISVKYVSIIAEAMKQTLLFFRGQIHQGFSYLWMLLERFLLHMFTNGRSIVSRPTGSECQVENVYSDVCIVCQDRQRCVIILPCRHLCLCKECCAGVQQHNGRCPLCRQTVSRVMKVYV